jgi:hypothetical protein
MEAIISSEMSVFTRATRRYIQVDVILHLIWNVYIIYSFLLCWEPAVYSSRHLCQEHVEITARQLEEGSNGTEWLNPSSSLATPVSLLSLKGGLQAL